MKLQKIEIFQQFEGSLDVAIFQRTGGVSAGPFESLNVRYGIGDPDKNVRENRSRICNELGIKPDRLISLNQVHGEKILKVDTPLDNEIDGYDAMITSVPGLYLMIQVGDCQAVSIYDPEKKVIANIHSGWKGSAHNIVGKTVVKLIETGSNPADLYVSISPSLGLCHSEFSDPHFELPEHLHRYIKENNHVDFWSATVDQLKAEGVLENRIEKPTECTVCNSDKYFSYRAGERKAGDFAVVIGMKD